VARLARKTRDVVHVCGHSEQEVLYEESLLQYKKKNINNTTDFSAFIDTKINKIVTEKNPLKRSAK
jgi:hypothetical protein